MKPTKITQIWPYQQNPQKLILDKYKKQRMICAFFCGIGITSGSVLLISALSDKYKMDLEKIFLEAICMTEVAVSGAILVKKNQMIGKLREEIEPNTVQKVNKSKILSLKK